MFHCSPDPKCHQSPYNTKLTPLPFTAERFAVMLEIERRLMEVVITAIITRAELRKINLADDTVAALLELRVRQLRN
jgi:hypothetical protein